MARIGYARGVGDATYRLVYNHKCYGFTLTRGGGSEHHGSEAGNFKGDLSNRAVGGAENSDAGRIRALLMFKKEATSKSDIVDA